MIAGKDKGVKGTVVRAFPREEMVIIEGVNVKKKHQKATRRTKQGDGGQIIEVAAPIHVSNVMVADPKDGKPTRIKRMHNVDTGKRMRMAVKSGTELE